MRMPERWVKVGPPCPPLHWRDQSLIRCLIVSFSKKKTKRWIVSDMFFEEPLNQSNLKKFEETQASLESHFADFKHWCSENHWTNRTHSWSCSSTMYQMEKHVLTKTCFSNLVHHPISSHFSDGETMPMSKLIIPMENEDSYNLTFLNDVFIKCWFSSMFGSSHFGRGWRHWAQWLGINAKSSKRLQRSRTSCMEPVSKRSWWNCWKQRRNMMCIKGKIKMDEHWLPMNWTILIISHCHTHDFKSFFC